MPQQINLYRPVLLATHRHFSARTIAQSLAVVVAGTLAACAWASLQRATLDSELQAASKQHAAERQSLQKAIAANPAAAVQATSLEQSLQALKRQVGERERMLAELMRGRIVDGRSHSARLRLIARTVPASAWLEDIALQDEKLSLSGRTLDPAALKPWIAALSDEPLLAGQALTTLKVEQAGDHWRFMLVQSGLPIGARP
ncbi:PilN domain-containing protein [Rhizobacter sp. OV335]|uniref:PilN domain-containing protein n=1 Tax=Rhizobacter sp. OV335 TaxID=1500264 RepID=UPI000917AE08|nr:PilN domain-containing protein [Rhizobacter sp. OV335]SHN12101.1 Fimbrial assembly protein (PilN) [Rhizobacter sp. OV335]